MPTVDPPKFVNNNPFAVAVQDEKGRTFFVQPFAGYNPNNPATDKACVVRGDFYRRYVSARGPLFPFPGAAVSVGAAPIPVAATPVGTPTSAPAANVKANGGNPAVPPVQVAEATAARTPRPNRLTSRTPAKGVTPPTALDAVSFNRLRQSIQESERNDITNDDVEAMVAYITSRRAKRAHPLAEKLESFANDLNEISAHRDPGKMPTPTRG